MRCKSALYLICFLNLCLFGCLKKQDECAATIRLSEISGFQKILLPTHPFTFTAFHKPFSVEANEPLRIYIEGDGRSRISRLQVSMNPTPLNPLALKLALQDPHPNVAYLARPCQYTDFSIQNGACHPEIWDNLRFSEPVIASINQAVEQLKQRSNAKELELIGFSGGASVAVLIAARRQDVVSLKTVAGDLDHDAMSLYHHTAPLQGSLNPIHYAKKIAHIPQHHYVGENDPIVPSDIPDRFIQSAGHLSHIQKTVLKNTTHHDGWEEKWVTCLGNE